jgi:hypothetical protein
MPTNPMEDIWPGITLGGTIPLPNSSADLESQRWRNSLAEADSLKALKLAEGTLGNCPWKRRKELRKALDVAPPWKANRLS